ncbi:ATP synthase subunit C lysine N-methyltransferase isoform X2 [Ischnura elegans]|uniref:ATP synthase subunit C lysine N-methyltransferase isoform X2 n=1 Tax=Ischnura elegans TaxID=197161 RepID=UPI001ED8BB3B|nr:ATP synthase subunit C lysine N-methyltransferase isoform X2 [Ischnura elegans]
METFLIVPLRGAAILLTAVCAPFVFPALRRVCLPYVPATTTQVNNVFQALKGRSGSLVDLGSGDGRIVLVAAKHGFIAKGVELNPWLILYSRFHAFREYRRGTISTHCYPKYHRTDLWKFQLHPFSNIVIFGVEEMMPELEEKLKKELADDAFVAACRFPLPNWTPSSIIGSGIDTVWLYQKNGKYIL